MAFLPPEFQLTESMNPRYRDSFAEKLAEINGRKWWDYDRDSIECLGGQSCAKKGRVRQRC